MTVEELITILQTHDPKTRVVVDGYEDGYDDILPVEIKTVDVYLNWNVPTKEEIRKSQQAEHGQKLENKQRKFRWWGGHHQDYYEQSRDIHREKSTVLVLGRAD